MIVNAWWIVNLNGAISMLLCPQPVMICYDNKFKIIPELKKKDVEFWKWYQM